MKGYWWVPEKYFSYRLRKLLAFFGSTIRTLKISVDYISFLTHIILSSFLWDIYKQCRTRLDATPAAFSWSPVFDYRMYYSKTCVKRPLSNRPQIGFQDQLSLNAGQKYCRMLQGEHSAILLTFIKLPFVIKIFVLSFFEWPFYTGFTVLQFE